MKNYFNLKRFYRNEPSIDILRKVQSIISILNPIRERLQQPIYITSSYRTYEWELQRGRSGYSEHVFRGKGAVDMACANLPTLFKLLRLLINYSPFTRLCIYPNKLFIHGDFKGKKRKVYIDRGNGWKRLPDNFLREDEKAK